MRIWAGLIAVALLSACVPTYPPASAPPAAPPPAAAPTARLPSETAVRNFVEVVQRLEPVTEDICRARTRGVNCDFLIVVDDRLGQPPNAFQTLDRQGRPVLGFTLALIGDARNPDEIAFVLGHEASHHILGHLPQTNANAQGAAMAAAILAAATGASPQAAEQLTGMAATVGARSYAKEFELQADAMGAEITYLSGYDPVLGTGFFDRLPDPGDAFLGTHPPNAARKAVVARVVADLRAGGTGL
jgi:predicted Zn-dependent protease